MEQVQPTKAQQQEMIKMNIENAQLDYKARNCQLFLAALSELRMALNHGKLGDGDTGLGERPRVEPMFDQTDMARLQKRYFATVDKYLGVLDIQKKDFE